METPSSIRRITRSQSKASSLINNNNNNTSILMSKKNEQRTMKMDRSALFDITNDSPIVGLAMDSSHTMGTPSSLIKKRNQPKKTPGSGEALLRGQVKILLQKVEEDCEIFKLSNSEKGPLLGLKGITSYSPSGILAPTPTNTPQVLNLSDINTMNVNGLSCEEIPIVKEDSEMQQDEMVMDDESKSQQTSLESQKSDITRSLLFDFSDFSSCSSVLTEGSVCQEKSTEEDDASVWSIQVNTSTQDEDGEQEEIEEEEEADYEEEDELVDELCGGLSKIFVQKKPLPEFEGKHTRFVYNSDGEIEGEEAVHDNSSDVSPTILRLNGLPTPAGKHLRFPEEED